MRAVSWVSTACRCALCSRCSGLLQVPIIAKADSMTTDELRQFRKYIRSELEQVHRHAFSFPCPHIAAHCAKCLMPSGIGQALM